MLKNMKIIGNPSVLRKANNDFIKSVIKENHALTKAEIALKAGLSLVTVGKLVEDLVMTGEVECMGFSSSKSGRKAKCYKINENYKYILCLFIQEEKYHIGMLNIMGDTVYSSVLSHKNKNWSKEFFSIIQNEIERFGDDNIIAIGIGIPGSAHEGVVGNIPSIPMWNGINLQNDISNRFSKDVVVENDVNSVAIGIHSMLMPDTRSMVFLHIQKGIRAAMIIENKLYKGRFNFAGEIASMRISSDYENSKNLEELINKLIKKKKKEKLIEIVTEILLNIICIAEPHTVAIETYALDKDDVRKLEHKLESYIDKKYIPEIYITKKNEACYIKGLYMLSMEKVSRTTEIYC